MPDRGLIVQLAGVAFDGGLMWKSEAWECLAERVDVSIKRVDGDDVC